MDFLYPRPVVLSFSVMHVDPAIKGRTELEVTLLSCCHTCIFLDDLGIRTKIVAKNSCFAIQVRKSTDGFGLTFEAGMESASWSLGSSTFIHTLIYTYMNIFFLIEVYSNNLCGLIYVFCVRARTPCHETLCCVAVGGLLGNCLPRLCYESRGLS